MPVGTTPAELRRFFHEFHSNHETEDELAHKIFQLLSRSFNRMYLTVDINLHHARKDPMNKQLILSLPSTDELETFPTSHITTKCWREVSYAYRNPSSAELFTRLMDFMQRVAKAIGERDSLFECRAVPVGSSCEGTKTGNASEFDINFELVTFSSLYEAVVSPACPNGFVRLKRKFMDAPKEYLSNELVYSRIDRVHVDKVFNVKRQAQTVSEHDHRTNKNLNAF